MIASRASTIAIAGTGAVGLTAALALHRRHPVRLLRPPASADRAAAPAPGRTAALFPASVRLLRRLDVWQHCAAEAGVLTAIRIIDDRPALLRAPDITFAAAELGIEALGYNIANQTLVTALSRAVEAAGVAVAALAGAQPYTIADDQVQITCNDGTIAAALLIAADGKQSQARAAAGLVARDWSYPQVAITAAFDHGREHHGVSTELHSRAGPCTTVPLPGRRSSLVWVETPETAASLLALDDDAFRRRLEQRLAGLLGSIGAVSGRVGFPLSGLLADPLAARRTVLVGEAAHAFPPIGAQGLNLGLRDVEALVECLDDVSDGGRAADPGGARVLNAYQRAREWEVRLRTYGVDALDRSLLTSFLPAHWLRGAGLSVLKLSPALRRAVMRGGLIGN